jgi:hypothetical protein
MFDLLDANVPSEFLLEREDVPRGSWLDFMRMFINKRFHRDQPPLRNTANHSSQVKQFVALSRGRIILFFTR